MSTKYSYLRELIELYKAHYTEEEFANLSNQVRTTRMSMKTLTGPEKWMAKIREICENDFTKDPSNRRAVKTHIQSILDRHIEQVVLTSLGLFDRGFHTPSQEHRNAVFLDFMKAAGADLQTMVAATYTVNKEKIQKQIDEVLKYEMDNKIRRLVNDAFGGYFDADYTVRTYKEEYRRRLDAALKAALETQTAKDLADLEQAVKELAKE